MGKDVVFWKNFVKTQRYVIQKNNNNNNTVYRV